MFAFIFQLGFNFACISVNYSMHNIGSGKHFGAVSAGVLQNEQGSGVYFPFVEVC